MSADIFLDFITRFKNLSDISLPIPEATAPAFPQDKWPERDSSRKCALIFAPHPDDECLMGGLPLRLLREENWQIINVAVTLGSAPERKAPRWLELSKACTILGFTPLQPVPNSFDRMHRDIRIKTPEIWKEMAQKIAEILTKIQPDAIFFPHSEDLHYAHIATHDLILSGLELMPKDYTCPLGLMEYWHPNKDANCMVALTVEDTAQLLKALTCHSVENVRNPYNVRLPPYLIDNVRRGCELIAGRRSTAPDIDFAMMYRIGIWKNGQTHFQETTPLILPETKPSTAFNQAPYPPLTKKNRPHNE